ncbi:hypothetical protein [Methylobacterium sp. UNC378MF]|uniref:hypothetical protein n=1 Tax=Methylobacterium sp. UNC378MF TaxID=1502748 RepID=UPI000B84E842|nr:hypothetical protein [Methylobacterium sp. UNC378MF]
MECETYSADVAQKARILEQCFETIQIKRLRRVPGRADFNLLRPVAFAGTRPIRVTPSFKKRLGIVGHGRSA